MEQAKGFEIENKNSNERLVYELKKSLYGLKQSGRNWNNLLHTVNPYLMRVYIQNIKMNKRLSLNGWMIS